MRVATGIDWTASSFEQVRERHRWEIPERLNIGVIACDQHADGSGRVALRAARDGATAVYTFDDLKVQSDALAGVLAGYGVGRGDRVAVFLSQRVENAVAHLAILKLGAVSVPLSPLFRADALSHRLTHSGAKVVVTDDEHRLHLPAIPGLRTLRCEELPELTDGAEPLERPVDTSRDDPAMLIYTSGTTGLPKGALHAHRFVPGRLSAFELLHRLESEPSSERPFYTPADWAWIGGLVDCVLTPWVFGCPVLAYRSSYRGFDAARFYELLLRERVRSLFLPPTAIRKLRAADEQRAGAPEKSALDLTSVHTAGEPLSPEDYAWAMKRLGGVRELYGMTEMGATIGNAPFFPVRPGSMGKPMPGHDVALIDAEGQPVPPGVVGEIAVREGDPGMFLGYLDDAAATRGRFRGPWFVTGDLARADDDGYLFYQGRDDDMFNTSGYRVGPTEIEASLVAHPSVAAAAVVGEPDAERGHVVKAFVVLRDGVAPSNELLADLQAHVRGKLAAYEYPRRIVFARELPLTTTGKIIRAELRARDADARYGLGWTT